MRSAPKPVIVPAQPLVNIPPPLVVLQSAAALLSCAMRTSIFSGLDSMALRAALPHLSARSAVLLATMTFLCG
jgi:hypothetical protein